MPKSDKYITAEEALVLAIEGFFSDPAMAYSANLWTIDDIFRYIHKFVSKGATYFVHGGASLMEEMHQHLKKTCLRRPRYAAAEVLQIMRDCRERAALWDLAQNNFQ